MFSLICEIHKQRKKKKQADLLIEKEGLFSCLAEPDFFIHAFIYLYLYQIGSCCTDGLKLTILLSLCLVSGIIGICCHPDLYFHIYFFPLNFDFLENISFKFGFLLYYLKYHRVFEVHFNLCVLIASYSGLHYDIFRHVPNVFDGIEPPPITHTYVLPK